MSSVTSTRVSKGNNKFAPKAKPRPARRTAQNAQNASTSEVNQTEDARAEQQDTSDNIERSEQQMHHEQLRGVPAGATVIGVPSVIPAASTSSGGIPSVGASSSIGSIPSVGASTSINGIPSVGTSPQLQRAGLGTHFVIGGMSPRFEPPRLQLSARRSGVMNQTAPLSVAGAGAGAGTGGPRLASLSSPISPASLALGASRRSANGGTRFPGPPKRVRTGSSTPEARPLLQMRSAADYSTLSTEEISNLPIAYFCRDTRHGQPTTEFIERENDVIRKLNAPPETQASSEETPAQASVVKAPLIPSKVDSQPQTVNRMAAQVRIVDGQVVIDTDSLVVNRSDMAGGTGEPLDVVDESARTQFTNSLTYVVQRTSRKRWKPEETEMFYQKLRIYGTDFQMLAAELPGRNRYDVRNKFKVEERKNGLRITETLLRRDPQPPKSPQQPIPTGLPESLETYSIAATPESQPQPQSEPGLESESGLKADSVDHLNGSDSDDMSEARDLFGLPSIGTSKAGS